MPGRLESSAEDRYVDPTRDFCNKPIFRKHFRTDLQQSILRRGPQYHAKPLRSSLASWLGCGI